MITDGCNSVLAWLSFENESIVDDKKRDRCIAARWWLLFSLLVNVFWGTGLVSAQQPPNVSGETKIAPSKQTTATLPTVDSLGDPLPVGALLRLGTVRFHPPSGTSELALSPDEKTLVTIGKQIIVWDPATGKERWRAERDQYGRSFSGSRYGAKPIAFSSDSSHFFTTSGPTQIAIWDIATSNVERLTIKTKDGAADGMLNNTLSLDVAPDGKTFALGRFDGVVVCNKEGEVRFEVANVVDAPFKNDNRDRLAFFGYYSCGRFSPDGTKLAIVTSDQPEVIRIHDTESGRELQKISLTAKLVRLAFSADGKQIVATERDSSVRLYQTESGKKVWAHTVPLNNPNENYVSAVAFSPDGKTIAAGATDHLLYLLDPLTGDEIGKLEGTHWYPWTMAFTADSKILYSSGWDGTIRRWDVVARQQLPLPQGFHASEVVTASPDGRTLAYQDDRRIIRLVKSDTSEELKQFELPGMNFSQLQFSPDGDFLAGGGSIGDQVQVVLWNVKTAEKFRTWAWPKGRDPHSHVESLCFTPDGSRLAAAVFRQSAAYIWDLASDQQIAKLKHGQVYGLSFSADGKTLATAGWDSIVRFWKTESGELTREFRVSTEKDDNGPKFAVVRKEGQKLDLNQRNGDLRMYTVCYAPEGDLIATAHMDGEVWVWQSNNMQPLMRIPVGGSFVYGAMSFSPDGLWLATGTSGGKVRLWDPLTGQQVWDRGAHEHYVYTVAFGRDNRTIVSGADDGVCYLWDLQPAEMHPHRGDLTKLWDDLAGENSATAYQAMWGFLEWSESSKSTDQAVNFIAEKLRPVKSLIDTNHIAEGISDEENQRQLRMKKLLAAKDPKVELTIVARRAVSVLEQIGTPAATQLLNELANRDANGDLATLVAKALNRQRVKE